MDRKLTIFNQILAVAGAMLVIFFVSTGVLLNHANDLDLDQQYFSSDSLLAHYGLSNVEADSVYLLEHKVISQFGQQVFVDSTPVMQETLPILGGVRLDDVMILATRDALLVLTIDGEFVERLSVSVGVPPLIQNIGLFHGEPVIQTRDGLWRSNFMLETWEKLSLEGVSWSAPQPMPDSVSQELASYFHGRGVSLERILTDIHSGHILGELRMWFIDITALLILIWIVIRLYVNTKSV